MDLSQTTNWGQAPWIMVRDRKQRLTYSATVGALQDEISTIDIQSVVYENFLQPVAISIGLTMDDGTRAMKRGKIMLKFFQIQGLFSKPTMMYVSGLIGQVPSSALEHLFGKLDPALPTVCLERLI